MVLADITVLVKRKHSFMVVDGEEKSVDYVSIAERLWKIFPEKESEELAKLTDEVVFRISDGEYDSYLYDGRSVETAYTDACVAYIRNRGEQAFFDEVDDCEIFDYLGEDALER